MLLALGPHQFDITYRAVVMGVVDAQPGTAVDSLVRDAEQLVAQRPGALTVGWSGPAGDDDERQEIDQLATAVAALTARFGQPVAVRTRRASVVDACLAAGAVAAHDDAGVVGPDYLAAVASAGATVVVGAAGRSDDVAPWLAERARGAGDAGLDAARLVVDPGGDRSASPAEAAELWRDLDCVARLGLPVLLSTSGDRVSSIAMSATGILRGGRILRTRDVRAARRVAEVAARLLRARDGLEHGEGSP